MWKAPGFLDSDSASNTGSNLTGTRLGISSEIVGAFLVLSRVRKVLCRLMCN